MMTILALIGFIILIILLGRFLEVAVYSFVMVIGIFTVLMIAMTACAAGF